MRDLTSSEEIDLVYCRGEDHIVDIFTKALNIAVFQKLRRMLGVSKA